MAKTKPIQKISMGVFNAFMRFILRSPLHRIASRSVLIISMTGRKSGRIISTPVSYMREGDTLTIFTNASWRNNLEGGALVRLWIANREYTGWAMVHDEDKQAAAQRLARFLTVIPGDAPFHGVTIKDGVPDAEKVAAAARRLSLIEVKLSHQRKGG